MRYFGPNWFRSQNNLARSRPINSFFLRFGISSIRAHPLAYLRHVRGAFLTACGATSARTLPVARRDSICSSRTGFIERPDEPVALRSAVPASVLTPYPSEEIVKGEVASRSNLPLMFNRFFGAPISFPDGRSRLGCWPSCLLSILFLVPSRLAYLYRTEIMIALSLNAYFGAHVLLQVSLDRYAAAAVFAAIFLAASFVFTTSHALKPMLAALASAVLNGRAATTGLGGRGK